METIGHPILKDSPTDLRTLDELIRLVELRMEELERRVAFLEARARRASL